MKSIRLREKLTLFCILIFSVGTISAQTTQFNADSVYATIEHLSVTIGPRPIGSAAEQEALRWSADQFARFGADSAYVMWFKKAPTANRAMNTHSGTALGIFRGRSDSTIVVGGHIDSDTREIAGANDNASGTATAIELARIWSERPRYYTMIFAAFGGEERGLCGSEYFVRTYEKIDDVLLMISADMTGADEAIETIFESEDYQAPSWFVKDAFRLDEELGINRLRYPTHFVTLNNIASGAGSDHLYFLRKNIPAIDFTTGINHSPIHTFQDEMAYIHKPSLESSGRLIDGLLTLYQEEGIPANTEEEYMLLSVFGTLVFLRPSTITVINCLALGLAVFAFVVSHRRRLRVEKAEKIRFSGIKLFAMFVLILLLSRTGETALELIKGLRYPWFIQLNAYLWYAAGWAVAGVWLALQFTKRWRFNPDSDVYVKRILIILFVFTLLFMLGGQRLALYPAISLFIFSIALLVPNRTVSGILALVSVAPLFRLMFTEALPFAARGSTMMGMAIDKPLESFLAGTIFVVVPMLFYLPYIFVAAFAVTRSEHVKKGLIWFRRPVVGVVLLALLLIWGGVLSSMESYSQKWRPSVNLIAQYDLVTGENKMILAGNDYFKDVRVVADSLFQDAWGKTNREELEVPFSADWINATSSHSIVQGESDTVSVLWRFASERSWHQVILELETDSLTIEDFQSDIQFKLEDGKVLATWFADPPTKLEVEAQVVLPKGEKLIRQLKAKYAEMPVPIKVHSEMANVSYRTELTRVDTLVFEH